MAKGVFLVTGASGLLGSNICEQAARRGRNVRGLVRSRADAAILEGLGVAPFIGDIAEPSSLDAAMTGADAVIHSAAVIGGTWSVATDGQFENVNYHGVLHVADAAARHGVRRLLMVSTLAILDSSRTITETSALVPASPANSPYVRSKLAAFHESMQRVSQGAEIGFLFPAAMYGPSPFPDRAVEPTLFTGTMLMALRGELDRYARFPLSWPFVADVADIALAAIDVGKPGERFLGVGRPEDERSLAAFCNVACELAGVAHRVEDVAPEPMMEALGSMAALAGRSRASPLADPGVTLARTGVALTPLAEGIAQTIAWLRAVGKI